MGSYHRPLLWTTRAAPAGTGQQVPSGLQGLAHEVLPDSGAVAQKHRILVLPVVDHLTAVATP